MEMTVLGMLTRTMVAWMTRLQDLSVPTTSTKTSAASVPQDLLTTFKLFLHPKSLQNRLLSGKPQSPPPLKWFLDQDSASLLPVAAQGRFWLPGVQRRTSCQGGALTVCQTVTVVQELGVLVEVS
jgi:hypothetical protein